MMTSAYDFHLHSLFSDGSMTVDELFAVAAKHGMKALALTDHDTVLGIPEELKASRRYGIPYVPAAEFTAMEDGRKFHVLGYGIDPEDKVLLAYSKEFLDAMNRKSERQIRRLQRDGVDIPTAEFFRQAGGGPLYRGKLLGVLAGYGYLKQEQIMSLIPAYFAKDAPYYETDEFSYRSFEGICSMIHNAGGVAVLAHPAKIRDENAELYECLLQSPLLDGVEVYHPRNPSDVRSRLLQVASDQELMITGGSDCHGIYMKKMIPVGGEEVPDVCSRCLENYLRY